MKLFQAYLRYAGECAEAMRFYQSCLGGELELMLFSHSPMAEHTPPEWRDKVMHASLISNGCCLMASDGMPGAGKPIHGGMSLTITPDDVDSAERIFNAMSVGGNITMPLQQTFFAARFGEFTDRFGIAWMIHCEK